jgi:UDP-glucose:(heptosyl)LPS alpha-1,3-glucosyltransferase
MLGVIDNVLFCGPTKESEKLYAAADVFVLPTVYDPFSNACLEAMASGVPVVTSKINGVSELIEDGITGVCVEDPSDVEALKQAIEQLLQRGNSETIEWAKTKGRLMNMENHIRETIECYETMLFSRRVGSAHQ